MSNFAKVIKEEISRVARKEQRSESSRLKKTSANYRAEISALKRRVGTLEQLVKKLSKNSSLTRPSKEVASGTDTAVRLRFSAGRLRAQRERQNLSAPMLARLIGVSAQSIYNWEGGQVRPNATQLAALAASRKLTNKQIAEKLGL